MSKTIKMLAYVTALCLVLCGCNRWESRSYLSVSEHVDPYALKETETTEPGETEEIIQSASNYYSIRTILKGFICNGVEHGQLRLTNYEGEVEEDLHKVTEYYKNTDPVGAYAVDYLSYEKVRSGKDWLVTIDAVYRRSANEIQSIRSVRGNERAYGLIYSALSQFDSSITLQISGFTEEDFGEIIRNYCLEHPETVVQQPETSVTIYPETGNVRIVELHFSYGQSKDDIRKMTTDVTAILNSAAAYVRSEADDAIKANMLYSYLLGRFNYTQAEKPASVYNLLCEGVADSAAFASVFAYLCKRAGVECRLVDGTKDGQSRMWNIVKLSDVYYHVDLMQCAMSTEPKLQLLFDENMVGYSWDTTAYPVCGGQPLTEETQAADDG